MGFETNLHDKWVCRLRELLLFLSSAEFVLVCFFLAMILVVIGTAAQAEIGNFMAQQYFFNSFFIYVVGPFDVSVPVFPGGLSVGLLWILSIIAAMCVRSSPCRRSLGLFVTHLGILLLLLGQFFSQVFSQDLRLFLEEAKHNNYAVSVHEVELAIISRSLQGKEETVSLPYSELDRGVDVRHASLPFLIRVKSLYPNSELLKLNGGSEDAVATEGVGKGIFVRAVPAFGRDENNVASALIDILDGEKSLGTWLVSSAIEEPQVFQFRGKEYGFMLRSRRESLPFSLTLKEFSHDVYPGTDIPKNYSSLVHLSHPERNESRDVLIYMNHPLRYGGYSFYQASFGENNTLSILQVVKNPAWLAPYVSCTLMLLGLVIMFLGRLLLYLRRV